MSQHPTTVKNVRQIITFIPKLLHNSNTSRTFAAPEPPSLLTMLNRRQTESNVKLVWTLPRCEGGRALLKLKSGVVLFLYHLWDYCSISLLCNLMIWLSCFDLEGWKSTTLREFPIIYATSVIIGRAVVEHYMTKTGTVEKRKDGAVCTHLFNINRIIFTDSSLNPLTFGSFICGGDKSTRK